MLQILDIQKGHIPSEYDRTNNAQVAQVVEIVRDKVDNENYLAVAGSAEQPVLVARQHEGSKVTPEIVRQSEKILLRPSVMSA